MDNLIHSIHSLASYKLGSSVSALLYLVGDLAVQLNTEPRLHSDRIQHCGEITGFPIYLSQGSVLWLWWCKPQTCPPRNVATYRFS